MVIGRIIPASAANYSNKNGILIFKIDIKAMREEKNRNYWREITISSQA